MSAPDTALRDLTGYRLRRATVATMAAINPVFAEYGLRRTTFSVLAVIVGTPGLRQADLAAALDIERPNLVQIVNELETAGLAIRKSAPEDRRANALHPTPLGQDIYAKAMQAALALDAQLIKNLTPDHLAALHSALDIIEATAKSTETENAPELSRP